ncbi:MAG: GNAT family N-acetyltransferase, partial [Pseudomonadota bacterium]
MTDLSRLYDAVEATWPAAHMWQQDGWTMRDGAGGGKRVSAATA